MRIITALIGIVIAALGGVVAYRAAFIEPSAAVLLTDTNVRELPNTPRLISGLALLLVGATLAFLALRRRRT
jgi:hypothetical protein